MEKILELIRLSSNYDKDNRYMAISDLCQQLEKSGSSKVDISLENKLCNAILQRLDDQSNDVQSIAVKCLSLLMRKVREDQVFDISEKLCNYVLIGKEELRDIYSIGLKAALKDMPPMTGYEVASKLITKLIEGVKSQDVSVKLECIDITGELILKYGKALPDGQISMLSKVLFQQLAHEKSVVRKRTIHCLGNLVIYVSDDVLESIITKLLDQIQSEDTSKLDRRTLIQAIGTISKTVGYRMGPYTERIIRLLLASLKASSDESMQNEQGDELRENILNALESFVIHCPSEVTRFTQEIVDAVSDFLVYDPNYSYDIGEENEMDDEDDEYDDDEYDDEEDYSDDDDTSWKVRRASIRLLFAVVTARADYVAKSFEKLGLNLINQFKEREESVKVEIIHCFTAMVKAVENYTKKSSEFHDTLKSLLPELIKISTKQIFDVKKLIKAKVAGFVMLRASVMALDGEMEQYLSILSEQITKACSKEKDPALKLEGLSFLQEILVRHSPSQIQPLIHCFCPMIVECASDDWYKVVAQALRDMKFIVPAMRPLEGGMVLQPKADFEPFIAPLYHSVLPKLSYHDIDQEIKESAIETVGQIFAYLGDFLDDELPKIVPLLQEKLKNEMTRLSVLRCLASIANSPLKLNLRNYASLILKQLSPFLRQQSRALREQTLETMNSLIKEEYCLSADLLGTIILPEVATIITDTDLHLCKLALEVCISCVKCCPGVMPVIKDVVFGNVETVMQSPLLQRGPTLDALLAFVAELSRQNSIPLDYDTLFRTFLNMLDDAESDQMDVSDSKATDSLHLRNAVYTISRALGVLSLEVRDDAKLHSIIDMLIEVTQKGQGKKTQVAIGALGYIGRHVNMKEKNPKAFDTLIKALESKASSEAVRTEAAIALGNMTIGSINEYLPTLVGFLERESSERQQYLFLCSMLEIIASGTKDAAPIVAQQSKIMSLLEKNCENNEEGVRNMVAECIGKLAIIDPAQTIPYLASLCKTSSVQKRWTLATAIKFIVVNSEAAVTLAANSEAFLALLKDDDLNVRRAAFLSLNSIAHHNPRIIEEHSTTIMTNLLEETKVKPELKRKVDLGPFKHTIDDGLPLRKAAFSTINTILASSPKTINVQDFMPYLVDGLSDVEDIKLISLEILTRLCHYSPIVTLAYANKILGPISASFNAKMKERPVDGTRINDVLRSSVRALEVMKSIPQAAQIRAVQGAWENVLSKPYLKEHVQKI